MSNIAESKSLTLRYEEAYDLEERSGQEFPGAIQEVSDRGVEATAAGRRCVILPESTRLGMSQFLRGDIVDKMILLALSA